MSEKIAQTCGECEYKNGTGNQEGERVNWPSTRSLFDTLGMLIGALNDAEFETKEHVFSVYDRVFSQVNKLITAKTEECERLDNAIIEIERDNKQLFETIKQKDSIIDEAKKKLVFIMNCDNPYYHAEQLLKKIRKERDD